MTEKEQGHSSSDQPPWLEPVGTDTAEGAKRPLSLRLVIGGLAAAIVLLFAALIWILYSRGAEPQGDVLVHAPEGPVKVAPEDRGGMQVPDQDKLVFDRVTGESSTVEEKLRPEAEAPLGRPEVPALDDATPASDEVVGADGTTQEASAPPAQTAPKAAPAAEAWSIQIAAFRQKWHAETWLARAESDYEDVFRGLAPRIEETERDMAKYYRIRFGPLEDRAAARARCAAVEKAGLNCIVVPPGR